MRYSLALCLAGLAASVVGTMAKTQNFITAEKLESTLAEVVSSSTGSGVIAITFARKNSKDVPTGANAAIPLANTVHEDSLLIAAPGWNIPGCSVNVLQSKADVEAQTSGSSSSGSEGEGEKKQKCSVFVLPSSLNKLARSLVDYNNNHNNMQQHDVKGTVIQLLLTDVVEGSAASSSSSSSSSDARNLGATTNILVATQIYMMPEIMEGLLISLLLIFFVFVGVYCTMGIQGPDMLFATNQGMRGGKEY